MTGIFATLPHTEPFAARPSDPRVFAPAKARFAKPKTKEEAAALHDVDDADDIRDQIERSGARLRKPKNDD